MMTNTPCTLYNAYEKDGRTFYERTVLQDVFWDGAFSGGGTGKRVKNEQTGRIFVPFSVFSQGKGFLLPKEWAATEGKTTAFTLKPGDYLVKGICEIEFGPDHPIRHMAQEQDEVVCISSVQTRDFGSSSLCHWEIGGV